MTSESTNANKTVIRYECPFNWKMDEFIKNIGLDLNMEEDIHHDEENDIPILKIMRTLMKMYEGVLINNWGMVERNLQKVHKIHKLLNEKELEAEKISKKVVDHIINATEYYILLKMKDKTEADKVKKKLENFTFQSDIEKSSLDGCKCIAWSKYYEEGCKKAIVFAKSALKYNPNYTIWNYLLGLNLRRERRGLMKRSCPTLEEKKAFYKAYEVSKNPIFGIYLAQSYKESQEYERAKKMYEQISEINPESCLIQCRLAMGFMSFKDFESAKKCLNFVEERHPEDSMFRHYKALYLMNLNRYSEACYYFEKAAEMNNFAAELNYIECRKQYNPKLDSMKDLEELLKKYDNNKRKKQQVFLNMAMCCYLKKKELENAMLYFFKAINVDPDNSALKNFLYSIGKYKKINVFDFLENVLLPEIQRNLKSTDVQSIHTYNILRDKCFIKRIEMKQLTQPFKKLKL